MLTSNYDKIIMPQTIFYLAFSKVAVFVFPTAPKPTPTARPSERKRKLIQEKTKHVLKVLTDYND